MKRHLLISFAMCVLFLLAKPQQSEAGFQTSLSLGGNYSLQLIAPKDTEKIGFNIEGILAWRLPFLSIDLGIFYDFLKRDFQLRPGAKVILGWFYIRAAIPLSFDFKFQPNNLFNMGVLVGLGFEFNIKKFAIFAEANIAPFFLRIDITDTGGGIQLPAELRLGVAYNF